ncbi:MAG: hypothetical protein WCJ94_07235 [bacterium]
MENPNTQLTNNEDLVDTTEELIPVDLLLINRKYRMFGSILVMLRKYENESIGTIAVTMRDSEAAICYNKKFMKSLSIEHKIFVLLHEASHLILASHSRSDMREKTIWNIATDMIINELLQANFGIKIPADALSFKTLKRMKVKDEADINIITADELYNLIVSKIVKVKYDGYRIIMEMKDGFRIESRRYGGEFTDESIEPRLAEKIRAALTDYKDSSGPGYNEGDFLKNLQRIIGIYFPFEQVLRKIFERRDYDFSRRNRRLKSPDSFFPRKKNPAYKVYAAVDVSGSTLTFTEKFLSYITALPEFEEVVFFDTAILHIVKKGDKLPQTIKAYGGTDLNPVITRWLDIERKNRHTKLNFVCLTDGYIAPLVKMTKAEILILTCGIEIEKCKNIKIIGR